MDDPAVRALRLLLAREGGAKLVAATIHAHDKTLYQIASGRLLKSGRSRGVGRELREKLERHYPGWLQRDDDMAQEPPPKWSAAVQTITPASTGRSHAMRLAPSILAPPTIEWSKIMQEDLPPEFQTALPDNAMAPDAPRGTRCIFVTDATPQPGDWILVSDAEGHIHCREYRVVSPGRWEAHAIHRAYLPMHSEEQGLTIIAVFDGMRGRRSAR
jgi:hypothetical protein